mmetsp:Transcript_47676/g.57442  ORF Transcript_47676/g.57442 Transcript_47676/m.57442 type:complete len:136 (-) Transcript_47676:318-725(-)
MYFRSLVMLCRKSTFLSCCVFILIYMHCSTAHSRPKYSMKKEKTTKSQFLYPVQTSKKYAMEGQYKHDSWYVKMDAASKSFEITMDAIEQVRATINAYSRTTKSQNKILRKIQNKQVLFSGNDTTRAFICKGDSV